MFFLLQYLLPKHLISRMVGVATRVRVVWFKNLLIRAFVRGFQPDMRDAIEPSPLAYGSFNEFFTRALRADARPLAAPSPGADRPIISPVDGTISELGQIDDERILQAKGYNYTLTDLLANQPSWAKHFRGGHFVTIYLAPYNYHRIHLPLAGQLAESYYVPGDLFSVNRQTANDVPKLFARNERIICYLRQEDLLFALILVGALNVGSMDTIWHGNVAPARQRLVSMLSNTELLAPRSLPAGAEMGRFNMGSTVILLMPPGTTHWRADLAAGRTLHMGEAIGELLHRP